jgi:hypothetical protein
VKITYRMDGIDFPVEVPDALATAFQSLMSRNDTARETAVRELSELKTRHDTLTTERDGLKTKLADATNPEKLEALISEAAQVRHDARGVLLETLSEEDADKALKGQSVAAIKKLVVSKLTPELRLDGKDDSYVGVAYDAIMAGRRAEPSTSPLTMQRGALPFAGMGDDESAAPRHDARPRKDNSYDANAARERMLKRNQEAWQGTQADAE